MKTREALSRMLEEYEGNISSNSSDIGYTNVIKMDLVKDPDFCPVASKNILYH